MDRSALDRIAQRAHDVLLADDVGEGARAMAAVERGAGGHGQFESSALVGAALGTTISAHGWSRDPGSPTAIASAMTVLGGDVAAP